MIKKEGSKWVLYTHDGEKILGTHKTKKEAVAQEVAINISKAQAAVHIVSKRKSIKQK